MSDRMPILDFIDPIGKNMKDLSDSIARLQYTPDADGYTTSWPFKVRNSHNKMLDLIFIDKKNDDNIQFDFSWGLDEFNININSLKNERSPDIVFFKRSSDLDAVTIQYKSNRRGFRAIMIFKETDLSVMERVYIETPDKVFELISCKIGQECIR